MKEKFDNLIIGEPKNLPEIIYKYRSWENEYHKEILSKQIVFMAKPTSFEDPLDCRLQKRYDLLTDKGIFEFYRKESNKKNPSWTCQQHYNFAMHWYLKSPLRDKEYVIKAQKEVFSDFDNKYGILSLTANSKSFKMWNTYSNSHKGFCIGFDTKKTFERFSGGGKISYYDELPDISPFASFEEEHSIQIFSKEAKWNDEEEYRTYKFYPILPTVIDRKIELPKNCFKEIIFGANMTNEDKNEIIKICKKQKLDVDFYIEKINRDNKITINNTTS